MKKNRLSNILTSLVLTFVLSLSLFLTIPLHAHAGDENQQTTTAVPEDAVDCQMGEGSFYVSPYNEFYPLNSSINVEFVLNSDEEIETSYKLSSDQWLTISTNCDTFFLACISAYQTDAPTTGCYYSERVCFTFD